MDVTQFHTGRSLGDPLYLDHLIANYVNDHRVVLQAGGHRGAWPYHLAKHFETVITFEPFHVNFVDLASLSGAHPNFDTPLPENVFPMRAGLWDDVGRAGFVMNGKNLKKGHIVKKGPSSEYYPLVTLDGVAPREGVGFICLDIEGAEIPALRGAQRILQEQHPVLAIEININKIAKGINYTTTLAGVLDVIPKGYREVETYGLDTVFVWEG